MWLPVHLKDHVIPDPSGQLAKLIVYITSTRVDLYIHQNPIHRECQVQYVYTCIQNRASIDCPSAARFIENSSANLNDVIRSYKSNSKSQLYG